MAACGPTTPMQRNTPAPAGGPARCGVVVRPVRNTPRGGPGAGARRARGGGNTISQREGRVADRLLPLRGRNTPALAGRMVSAVQDTVTGTKTPPRQREGWKVADPSLRGRNTPAPAGRTRRCASRMAAPTEHPRASGGQHAGAWLGVPAFCLAHQLAQ